MRALKAAVIVMGVLIVAGVAVVVVTIVQRTTGGLGPAAVAQQSLLDEPAGTRIAAVAGVADKLAVQLSGGGPDRVLLIDPRNGKVLLRAALAH